MAGPSFSKQSLWSEALGRRLNPEHGGIKRKAEDELEEERPAKRASPSLNIPMESREEQRRIWLSSEHKLEKMEGRRKKRFYARKMFITRIVRRLEEQVHRNIVSDVRDALINSYLELPGLDFNDEEDPDKIITDQFAQMLEEDGIETDTRVSEWDFLP